MWCFLRPDNFRIAICDIFFFMKGFRIKIRFSSSWQGSEWKVMYSLRPERVQHNKCLWYFLPHAGGKRCDISFVMKGFRIRICAIFFVLKGFSIKIYVIFSSSCKGEKLCDILFVMQGFRIKKLWYFLRPERVQNATLCDTGTCPPPELSTDIYPPKPIHRNLSTETYPPKPIHRPTMSTGMKWLLLTHSVFPVSIMW